MVRGVRFSIISIVLMMLAIVGCTGEKQEDELSSPNIVFILVDDLGWTDLGSYDSEFYDTPHIDAFAEDGIRFTDAYSAHPVCSPTRAAIMTGKDPVRVNITDWIPGMSTERAEMPRLDPPEDLHNLPLEEFTLAEAFKEHGYKTFYAGKWHLGEDAIIIFTSDNGGLTTLSGDQDIAPTSVSPLRAGKGWLYEGGIRVPLIVKAPGLSKGQVSRQPVTSMDYYPTLLELADLPAHESQHEDGESVVSYLRNTGNTEERTLVWHYPHYHGSTWRPGSAIRQGRWKLIEFYEQDSVELYDLSQDLGEQDNIAGQYPEKAESLRERMHSYIQKRGGQYPQRVE